MKHAHVALLCCALGICSYKLGLRHGKQTTANDRGEIAGHENLPPRNTEENGSIVFPSGYNAEQEPESSLEFESLISEALTAPSETDREIRFHALLQHVSTETAPGVERAIRQQLTGWEQQQRISALMYAWARIDGPAAADHVWRSQKDDPHATARLGATIRGWAFTDPRAAGNWVDQHETGNRAHLTQMLVAGWAESDHQAASEYVISRAANEGFSINQSVDALTESLYRQDPNLASEWARSLPNDAIAQVAWSGIAQRLLQQDVAKAVRWAGQHADVSNALPGIAKVAGSWASREPSAASEWSMSLSTESARASALDATMKRWAYQDPQGASVRIADLPASRERDLAIGAFAHTIAAEDPQSATVWADTIADQEIRRDYLIKTGQVWYQHDRHAASTWLASTDLSADDRDTVTRVFDEGEF